MYLSTIKDKDIGLNKYKSTPHICNLTTIDINKKTPKRNSQINTSVITSDILKCQPKK